MIWGVEGRHTWYPPLPAGYPLAPTVAERIAGGLPAALYDFILWLNPSLYWPLNLAHGATDQSGNGRNGTAQGGISLGGGASLTADPTDSSTVFDGSNDYISSAYTPAWAADWTMLGLINVTSLNKDSLFRDGNGGGLTVDPNNAQAGPVNEYHPPMPPTQFTNTVSSPWALRYVAGAPAVWSLFSEGAAIGHPAVNPITPFTGSGFSIGQQIGAWWTNQGKSVAGISAYLGGRMAHFAIFPRALTDDEIAAFYDFAGAPPFTLPASLTLNRRRDDAGAEVFPRFKVQKIGGLQSTGESGDRRDNKVRAQGELPRRSFRRGKTITYEGLTQATTRAELRQAEANLRVAFDDQENEGLMVVTPHPLYDASGDYRYFPARALTAEPADEITFSPNRANTHGHEDPFVVALRNARAGGVSYFDQDGVGYP